MNKEEFLLSILDSISLTDALSDVALIFTKASSRDQKKPQGDLEKYICFHKELKWGVYKHEDKYFLVNISHPKKLFGIESKTTLLKVTEVLTDDPDDSHRESARIKGNNVLSRPSDSEKLFLQTITEYDSKQDAVKAEELVKQIKAKRKAEAETEAEPEAAEEVPAEEPEAETEAEPEAAEEVPAEEPEAETEAEPEAAEEVPAEEPEAETEAEPEAAEEAPAEEPRAKGEKEFKAKHVAKTSGMNTDGLDNLDTDDFDLATYTRIEKYGFMQKERKEFFDSQSNLNRISAYYNWCLEDKGNWHRLMRSESGLGFGAHTKDPVKKLKWELSNIEKAKKVKVLCPKCEDSTRFKINGFRIETESHSVTMDVKKDGTRAKIKTGHTSTSSLILPVSLALDFSCVGCSKSLNFELYPPLPYETFNLPSMLTDPFIGLDFCKTIGVTLYEPSGKRKQQVISIISNVRSTIAAEWVYDHLFKFESNQFIEELKKRKEMKADAPQGFPKYGFNPEMWNNRSDFKYKIVD